MPVLVITAQPGHKLRALNAGARDFVSKPFDLVEVQMRIRNMLEVRLLYRKLDDYNRLLEKTVQERTAELRESEARFRSFTELSSDWYWEQDAQGNFTNVSGPVFEMLGIGEGDRPGESAAVAERNAIAREKLDANIAARQPFVDLIYTHSNADGSTQVLQVSGEPVFDSASRFAGYRGIGIDITGRHGPDQEQIRFRKAVDVIDQGVCLIDRANLRVVDVNETVCRMSGYDRRELYALELADLGLGAAHGSCEDFRRADRRRPAVAARGGITPQRRFGPGRPD